MHTPFLHSQAISSVWIASFPGSHTHKQKAGWWPGNEATDWMECIYVASHALLQFYILEVKIRLSIVTLVTYSV